MMIQRQRDPRKAASYLAAVRTLYGDKFDRQARAAFDTLTRDEQRAAVHRLRDEGYTDHGIAAATRLSVNFVRQLLGERVE